jgi:hypothetical protein
MRGDVGGELRGPRPDSQRGRRAVRGARHDGRSIRPTMGRTHEEPRIVTLRDVRGDVVGSV